MTHCPAADRCISVAVPRAGHRELETTMNRVRPATKSDYRAILGLEQQLLAAHTSALPGSFHSDGSDLPKRYFARLLRHPWSTVLIAEVDGVPAAYTVIRLVPETLADRVILLLPTSWTPLMRALQRLRSWRPRRKRGLIANRRVAFIDSFVVGKEFRRQRIADTLWETCQQWSRENGAEDIQFEVFEFNQAILSFIEYLGLKPFKRRYSKQLSDGGDTRGGKRV
jgi:ribosomal protein S18 acetylase RimI-like enzyme